MKTTLLLLLTINFVLFSKAQITTPAVKANFGVDADLTANFFNGAAQPAYDDWFSANYPGTGQFIIDTTGAAAIIAGYTSNPASRMLAFSRLMRQAPYTVVNNRLLLDAIFHRDFHGDDSTVFASGSNKNGMSPVNWSCPVSQGIPDKNDILDAFTHIRRAGPNVTDSMWMFSGISIENTTGSRYFDFELYQTDIYYDRPSRTFQNYGPDFGHTTWQFDAAGNVITPGDIIFTAEFSGTGLSLIQARIWIKQTSLSMTPAAFNWGGQFDGASSGSTYGYASILPKTAGAFYTGVQCVANTWAGPFNVVRVDNSVLKNYIANQFLEFSVNLTKLGLDPGKTINNPCGTPFRRVLIKTRSSASFTSELKDFIAPFRMFDFPKVNADTYITYFCGVMPPTTISVTNPNPTSIYSWSTSNGHFVGSTIGTSVVVDRPGKYIVTQQLDITCPFYSKDTVDIFFDSVCHILDVNLLNFNASKVQGDATLQWQVSNNGSAANYTVEYSYTGQNFLPLTTVPANADDFASYTFSYPYIFTSAPVVYYRLKITGKKGEVKYSNIISLQLINSANSEALIFPNPSTGGKLWFSVNSTAKENRSVAIFDAMGKMISTYTIAIEKGKNLIKMQGLAEQPRGTYLIKVSSPTSSVTQKIILTN